MGAYTNPPLLQQPNLAEIYQKSFYNAMGVVQNAYDRKRAREEAERQKDAAAANEVIKFNEQIANIDAASYTTTLQNLGENYGDQFADLQRSYRAGEIDSKEYNNRRIGLYQSVGKIGSLGKMLNQASEEYKDIDVSTYQGDPRSLSLVNAYKNGTLTFRMGSEGLEVGFKDQAGNQLFVDEKDLNNPNFYDPNEKFDTSSMQKIADGIFKDKIQKGAYTKTVVSDTGEVSKQYDQWQQGFGTNEQRINILKQKFDSIYNMDDAKYGSLFNDTLMQSKTEAERVASANIIIKEKGLKGNDAEALRSAFKTGYIDGKLSTGDNIKEIQRQYIVDTMSSDLVNKSDEFAAVRTSVTENISSKGGEKAANGIVKKLFGKSGNNIVFNDPIGLMKEIAASPSEYKGTFSQETGEYKDIYTDKKGKTVTHVYNLYKPSDLINFLDVYVNGRKFKDAGQIKIDINNLVKSPQVKELLQDLETQMYKPIPDITKPAGVTTDKGSLKNIGETSLRTGVDVNTIDIDEFN